MSSATTGRTDLLIVGGGTMGAELRRRAEGLDHVRFLGRLHPSELAQLYDGAVALVIPSIPVTRSSASSRWRRRSSAAQAGDRARSRRADRGDRGLRRWAAVPDDGRASRGDGTPAPRRRASHPARQPRVTTPGSACGRTSASLATTTRSSRPGATPLTAVILTYHAIEDGPRPLATSSRRCSANTPL